MPKSLARKYNTSFNPANQIKTYQIVNFKTNVIQVEEFDGDMKGGAITNVGEITNVGSISNVDSISTPVYEDTITGTVNYSLQEHLDGTSIMQISLFESGALVRRQSYICTAESDTKKVFVLLADTDSNHSTQILPYSSGIIGISTNGQETEVKIARLSLV